MGVSVYKVCSRDVWERAIAAGRYEGSDHDARDGFIHLSTATQLAGTLAKHYRDQRDLVLIGFDAEALGPELKWEPSRGGDLFPHLYGPLPARADDPTWLLTIGADGVPSVPDDVLLKDAEDKA